MSALVLALGSEDLGVGVMNHRELLDDIESDSGYESAKSSSEEYEIPKPEGVEVENPNPEGVKVENPKTKGKFKFKTIARGLGFLKGKDSEDEKLIRFDIPEHFKHQKIWGEYYCYEGAKLVLDTLKCELRSEIKSINLDKKPANLSISDFIKKIYGDLNKFIEDISEDKKQDLIETFLHTTLRIKLSPETFRKMIIEKILENNIHIFLDKKKEKFFESANSFKIVDGKKVPERLWDQERLKYKKQKWKELEDNYRSSSITKFEFNRFFKTEMEEDVEYVKNKRNEFKILEEINQEGLREEEERRLEKERIEKERQEKINQIDLEYQRKIDKISSKFKFLSTKLDDKHIETRKTSDKYELEILNINIEIINFERMIDNYKNKIEKCVEERLQKQSEYDRFEQNITEVKKSISCQIEETDKEIDDFIKYNGFSISTKVTLNGLIEEQKKYNGFNGEVVSAAYFDGEGNLVQEVEFIFVEISFIKNSRNIIIPKQKMEKKSIAFKIENLVVSESDLIEFKNKFKK